MALLKDDKAVKCVLSKTRSTISGLNPQCLMQSVWLTVIDINCLLEVSQKASLGHLGAKPHKRIGCHRNTSPSNPAGLGFGRSIPKQPRQMGLQAPPNRFDGVH
jgi:hypothetical protein